MKKYFLIFILTISFKVFSSTEQTHLSDNQGCACLELLNKASDGENTLVHEGLVLSIHQQPRSQESQYEKLTTNSREYGFKQSDLCLICCFSEVTASRLAISFFCPCQVNTLSWIGLCFGGSLWGCCSSHAVFNKDKLLNAFYNGN